MLLKKISSSWLKRRRLNLQEFESTEHLNEGVLYYLDYDSNHRIKAKREGLLSAFHRQQALSAV